MHFLSLISIYISSFIEISLVLFELWSWHGNIKSNKGDNLKIIHYKVMVLVLCLSLVDMYVYFKFHWIYSVLFRFMLNANKLWRTNLSQTDMMEGQSDNYMLSQTSLGSIKTMWEIRDLQSTLLPCYKTMWEIRDLQSTLLPCYKTMWEIRDTLCIMT